MLLSRSRPFSFFRSFRGELADPAIMWAAETFAAKELVTICTTAEIGPRHLLLAMLASILELFPPTSFVCVLLSNAGL